MINYTTKEKLTIITILTEIMEADGIIHPSESIMLDNVLSSFNMPDSTADILDDYDLNAAIKEFQMLSYEKQRFGIQLFKEMAACDGFVDEREAKIIEGLGSTDLEI